MGRSLDDLPGLHVLENGQVRYLLTETIKLFNTLAQQARTSLIPSISSQISKLTFLIIPNQTSLNLIRNQTIYCSSLIDSDGPTPLRQFPSPRLQFILSQAFIHPECKKIIHYDSVLFCFFCIYAMCGILSKSVSSFQKESDSLLVHYKDPLRVCS